MKVGKIVSTTREDSIISLDKIKEIMKLLADKPIVTHIEMSKWTFNNYVLPMLSPADRLFAVEMEAVLGIKVKFTNRVPSYSHTMEVHYSDGSTVEYLIASPFQIKQLGGHKWQK